MTREEMRAAIDEFFRGRGRRSGHCNVDPRYTSGSPAMVPVETAVRVALQEQDAMRRALDGRYGPEQEERARKLGDAGIVEARWELPRSKGWDVLDLVTGQRFERRCGPRCAVCGRTERELRDAKVSPWGRKLGGKRLAQFGDELLCCKCSYERAQSARY